MPDATLLLPRAPVVTSMPPPMLVVFGPGYCGAAIAEAAGAAGCTVATVARRDFTDAETAALLDTATHLLSTVPPGEDGHDPVLAQFGAAIARAARLRWLGYLSTTGVYGDRGGGWVDETTAPAPGAERSRRRLAAERAWIAAAAGRKLDILRLAGIYGPGRAPFAELRGGRARRIDKPGHAFGRIHRDDIVAATLAAMARPPAEATRILHLSDDLPAEPQAVIAEAARLLGLQPPPLTPFAAAWDGMSLMARSFWAEDRKVANQRTKAALDLTWRHPTYREGLRAILAEQSGKGGAQ